MTTTGLRFADRAGGQPAHIVDVPSLVADGADFPVTTGEELKR